jgi:hypothetical protein
MKGEPTMSFLRLSGLAALGIAFAATVSASDRLVTVDGACLGDTQTAIRAIQACGGRAKIVLPANFVIADIPDGREADLLATGLVSGVYDGPVNPDDFAYGGAARHIAAAWNDMFRGPRPERISNPTLPTNDAKMLPREYMTPLQPSDDDYYDVSEYMLGTVAVGVILPESDGTIDPQTEDWTQEEMDQVASQVISGLNWLVSKADWRPLVFYVVFEYQVPTGYEPITRPATDQQLWINQCFTALGYGDTYPGFPYVNALRDSLGTDWGTCIFVVDSSNDPDGAFSDGYFAFTFLGGPITVMTYDNADGGIEYMGTILAHETCHVFYALDENASAGNPCTRTSGYQAVENQNSMTLHGCAINVVWCIMRNVGPFDHRMCFYTKGQVGWNDTDGDSTPDILDTFPETALYAYSPDPDTTQTPTYSGSALVTALDNINPYGSGHDITLNRIAKVEWRVDGGPWSDAAPSDGAWGATTEDFYFTSIPLAEGQHVFEARSMHTYGNVDPTPAVDTLTIGAASGASPRVTATLSVENFPNPFRSRVEIFYNLPGEGSMLLRASIRIFDVGGRRVTTLLEGMVSPGTGRLSWDGTTAGKDPAPSGIYFIELTAGDSRLVKKLVLTR